MAVHEVEREDNNVDSLEERVLASAIPRKRGRCVENHERQQVKKFNILVDEKCPADKLTDDIMGFNHDTFYGKKTDTVVQDSYLLILLNITLQNRQQNRVENEDNRKNRNVSVRYTLLGKKSSQQDTCL